MYVVRDQCHANLSTGTRLVTEIQLLDLPTALSTFYIDTTEPHTPGIVSGCVI